MQLVRHRVNSIEELQGLRTDLGVELDLRSHGGRLIISHDPAAHGDPLDGYLRAFADSRRDRTLILNTKEDGWEKHVLLMLKGLKLKNFFFLDLNPATMVGLVRNGIHQVAVRVSEYESLETALRFKGLADWVWLDCFSGRPPDPALIRKLRKSFRVCLASPELHGYAGSRIARFKALAPLVDMVCTKRPDAWRPARSPHG